MKKQETDQGAPAAQSKASSKKRLEMAALSFVAADRHYRETYKKTGQIYEQPLNRETDAACKASNRALHILEQAAWNLAVAGGHATAEQAPSFAYLYRDTGDASGASQ